MLTIVTIALALPVLLVNCDNDAGLFFELAKEFKGVGPNCVVPTLKNPPHIKSREESWQLLTPKEKKIVKSCHSLLDPHCYNGFFKSVNKGYTDASVDKLCNAYRSKWEPCCNNTDPNQWEGPLKAYCPMYMGDCTGRSGGSNGAAKAEYDKVLVQGENKFDAMCPDYEKHCPSSNNKVKDAIRHVDLCYSLAVYDGKNCNDYAKDNQPGKLAVCRKYHEYCKPI